MAVSFAFLLYALLACVRKGSSTQAVLLLWIVVAGIGILCNMLLSFLGSYGCHKVAFRLLYQFRIRVMEHVGKVPIGFFSRNTSGSVQKTMDENIEKIEGFVAHMLPDILGSLLIVLAVGLDAIDAILDEAPIPQSQVPQMPRSWDVRFHNVSFSYEKQEGKNSKMALSHISFTAPQGKMTALVGPSGGESSQQAISELVNGRTVVMIAHRLWTLQNQSMDWNI